MAGYDSAPYQLDPREWPSMVCEPPGPRSRELHGRCTTYFKGLSSQVKLFPVAFESGRGCTLTDVDGNRYIDFSSGIYVTTLGHCHPRVTEAVQRYAARLMNCHDFTTEIKTRLVEKLAEILPGDLSGFQFYDCGTAAVEAGLRVCRAATGRHEFVSCFYDFHGKTYGAVSLAQMRSPVYGPARAPGFHMVPRPDPYRPHWTRPDGMIDTDRYIEFYEEYLDRGTAHQVSAFVLEPIQGWGGSVMPPDDFFPKLKDLCEKHGILLMADEVLTGMGRTGKWLALEHWDVTPDVVTLGKGLGNGFPVTAVAVRAPYTESFERISASSSYGGNPMACAAALAVVETIEEEGLLAHALELESLFTRRMAAWKERYRIVGDVRCKGCLMGVELVRDKSTKEPFPEAGTLVYRKAFRNGLAWIPAGHILRMSPSIVMPEEVADRAMTLIEEAIAETERELL
ncbi:MAG: aspartate aminotransferase family protein [Kiritimatiellaeota bacterium]|nr:aspartate aminotransferase family protein [Kiritimatiellota bacterium]